LDLGAFLDPIDPGDISGGVDGAVECTHCRVVMTSWSAPGSPIRYWQCPFCARTHSSLYGEVFRRRAGARRLDGALRPTPTAALPVASPEDQRWAKVKASAAKWFARLEAEETRLDRRRPAARAAPLEGVPEADPRDVVLIGSARRRRPGRR
jgi:hypothetical protein